MEVFDMAFMTQYRSFFISPFGEPSVCDDLNAFLRAHRIINVEKRMVDSERGTGWIFLVEYGQANGARQTFQGGGPKVDYREILNESEFTLFDALRRLRKEIADKQGLPVYTIFSNEQLANIAKNPPKSLKDLGAIPGIGEAKLKQYGALFLALLKEKGAAAVTESSQKKEGDGPLF
jgi:superfamily II DNA helicase RecQ